MKLIDGLSYRQWQSRNGEAFKSLTKAQQKESRQKGYNNVGWVNVKKSWDILNGFRNSVLSLFDHKLHKGDLVGAIDMAILDCDRAITYAEEGKANLDRMQAELEQAADEVLAKYPLL
ncbi:MAG: hypothetical protein N5P05_004146 (plasmid) [Chroococcopsis gigantea SAG 12.99]|jgi:hypothetical protein|nr:hypothetical protein [Chroococcopsis gigantea SAG 12.99]